MRLVTWNANGRFRDKIGLFSPKRFAALVIQECENTEFSQQAYLKAGWRFVWVGSNQHRGLGIFVPPDTDIHQLDWMLDDCEYFLPVKINNRIVVGVWAMGGKSPSESYAGQVSRFLDAYGRHLTSQGSLAEQSPIILGDFNSNVIWDKRHSQANHTTNNERLQSLGLASLYHAKKQQRQGSERDPTFYLYRHRDKPYHLDYAYVPKELLANASVKVGRLRKWLQYSDHMPVFADMGDR